MNEFKRGKSNLEIKTSYRYFLSDITPGLTIVLITLIFFGKNLLEFLDDSYLSLATLILFIFISIPIGFVINAFSFILFNQFIYRITLKNLIHYASRINQYHGTLKFWRTIFALKKEEKEQAISVIYKIMYIFRSYESGHKVNSMITRLQGLEILCRTYFLILLLVASILITRIIISIEHTDLVILVLSLVGSTVLFRLSAFLQFYVMNEIIVLSCAVNTSSTFLSFDKSLNIQHELEEFAKKTAQRLNENANNPLIQVTESTG